MTRLVVALPAEARPLVARFRLRRHEAAAWPLYRGEGVELVVSGVGKTAAAAATGWLAGRAESETQRAWINVGIAGHPSRAVGDCLLADRVEDTASGRVWYPPLAFEPPVGSAPVATVDRVERDYARDTLYDMEAAGFCAAATRLATAELIQVLKVVSDNPAGSREDEPRLSAERISELVEGALDPLTLLMERLAELASLVAETEREPALLAACCGRWRFSVTRRRLLRRLLGRLEVAEPGLDLERSGIAKLRGPAEVLAALEERLASAPTRVAER